LSLIGWVLVGLVPRRQRIAALINSLVAPHHALLDNEEILLGKGNAAGRNVVVKKIERQVCEWDSLLLAGLGLIQRWADVRRHLALVRKVA
jgi:hypothetical protein